MEVKNIVTDLSISKVPITPLLLGIATLYRYKFVCGHPQIFFSITQFRPLSITIISVYYSQQINRGYRIIFKRIIAMFILKLYNLYKLPLLEIL